MKLKNFNWSKWGFWIAIVLAIPSIYFTCFHKKTARIELQVLSNEELLSSVSSNSSLTDELSVIYRGVDLIEKNENISIVTLRVINTGSTNITPALYDKNHLLGFKLLKAEFLSLPTIIRSSDMSYFGSIITPVGIESFKEIDAKYRQLHDKINPRINFPELIIDPNDFFDIKCIVKHGFDTKPLIKPIGKISGTEIVMTTNSPSKSNDGSFSDIILKEAMYVRDFFLYLVRPVVIALVLYIVLIGLRRLLNYYRNKK